MNVRPLHDRVLARRIELEEQARGAGFWSLRTPWALALVLVAAPVVAQVDSPAPPEDPGSAMYTLEDVASRLETGAAGAKRAGAFVEPTSGPGAVAGVTLDGVMNLCPAVDETDGALASEVVSGKTFWGLRSGGGWGPSTGTLVASSVPATGQTTSYDSGTGVGDDGDLQTGVALPQPRFTKHGDGTVTDLLTGLVWLEKANCIADAVNDGFDNDGTANDGLVYWQTALNFVAALDDGTADCGDTSNGGSHQTDWRLPSLRELQSLIHYGYSDPALSNAAGTAKWTDGDPFVGFVSLFYWSSTTIADNTTYAWSVIVNSGLIYYSTKTVNLLLIWPVRGGQ